MSDDLVEQPKRKRKKGRRKGKSQAKKTALGKKALKIREEIFDPTAEDLSYITKNKELLKRHILFISRIPYAKFGFHKYKVSEGNKNAGASPKLFCFFSEMYPAIYERWVHILKCCFDPNYYLYPFFGGKGVSISNDFLDSRQFCAWCLKRGLTNKIGGYDVYLQRRNKNGNYSPFNCYVVTEKELHECKGIKRVLESLFLAKKYEEGHDPTVSYMTMYTRYYCYDLSVDDALLLKYDKTNMNTRLNTMGFFPATFYKSVATDKDVPFSVYMSRIHYSYLNGGFTVRPYDLLKEDFSVDAEAIKQGKVSYKRQWLRDKKEKEDKKVSPEFVKSNDQIQNSISQDIDVYSNNPELNVYTL